MLKLLFGLDVLEHLFADCLVLHDQRMAQARSAYCQRGIQVIASAIEQIAYASDEPRFKLSSSLSIMFIAI